MKSTGEVMGIDQDFTAAFGKAELGAGTILPEGGTVFVSVKDSDKPVVLPGVRALADYGFTVVATGGTADFLSAHGVPVERSIMLAQGRPHIVDRVIDGGIDMVFNTTEGWQSLKDSQPNRASALAQRIPYFTTAPAAVEAAKAIVEKMPMLQEGYEKLTADLRRLKEERPQIVEAIEEARAHGDLSENAEYHAAKARQGQIEA